MLGNQESVCGYFLPVLLRGVCFTDVELAKQVLMKESLNVHGIFVSKNQCYSHDLLAILYKYRALSFS